VGYSTRKTTRAWVWWGNFKEMIKDHFYPTSLQKAKENKFMQLEQGNMSVLDYASKFMEFFQFALAF